MTSLDPKPETLWDNAADRKEGVGEISLNRMESSVGIL